MMDYPVSDALRERLNRQMLLEGTAIPTREKKMGERSSALYPQFTAASRGKTAQGGNSGVYLAWVNPTAAMRKTAGRRTNRAAFLMIEGGRK